jgi:hypothetical protein
MMSISTQSPNGMNNVPTGQVQISVVVNVLKENKSAAMMAFMDLAQEHEAPEPE